MRSFSEEYKNGTFQSIFSIPISYSQVVLAKFFAVYIMFVLLWACSLFLFLAIGLNPGSIIREAAFASQFNISGGLLFISLVGMFFVAIGIFTSALTENQIVSCMLTFFVLLTTFIGGQFLADSSELSNLSLFGTYHESLNIFSQLDNFCNGVIDSRIIVFYLSSCALTLCFGTIAVQKKLT
jgi:ABC-2 type transport system permease protein